MNGFVSIEQQIKQEQQQKQQQNDTSPVKRQSQQTNDSATNTSKLLNDIKEAVNNFDSNVKYAHTIPFPTIMKQYEHAAQELKENEKQEWWYRSDIEHYLYNLGEPVVITDSMHNWEEDDCQLMSWEWLKRCNDVPILARNLDKFRDIEGYTLAHYVNSLLDHDERGERFPVYAKDLSLPGQWKNVLSTHLPGYLQYRDVWHDLLADVDSKENVNADPKIAGGITTVMMYIGSEATYTPLHWDVGGTMGHNVMVRAKNDGAAVWLCMPSASVEAVAEFCRRRGPNSLLDADTVTLPIEDLLYQRHFNVHVIVQRPGDLVLVPPLCTHQVININGPTIKVAWNTLPAPYVFSALSAVERARSVGKHPVCRVKSAIYHSLRRRVAEIEAANTQEDVYGIPNTETLLTLWRATCRIVREEWISDVDTWGTGEVQFYPDQTAHTRQCDACRADIFNRAFHCDECGKNNAKGQGFDLCLLCVANGRGCQHTEHMQLFQFLPLRECVHLIFRRFPAACARLIMLRGGTEANAAEFRYDQLELPIWPPHYPVPWATIAWHRIHSVSATLVHGCMYCHTEHFMRSMIQCSRCAGVVCEACLWHCWGLALSDEMRCAGTWACFNCQQKNMEKEKQVNNFDGQESFTSLVDFDINDKDTGELRDSARGICSRYVVPMHQDTQPGIVDQHRAPKQHIEYHNYRGKRREDEEEGKKSNNSASTTAAEEAILDTIEAHQHIWRNAQHKMRVLKPRVRRRGRARGRKRRGPGRPPKAAGNT